MASFSPKDYRDAYGNCFGAAWIGDLDRLKELVQMDAEEGDLAKKIASCKDNKGRSIFHFAAVTGRKRIFKYLIEELKLNVDDFIDGEGFTPLHTAIIAYQFTLAFYLLDKGANPNAADNRAYTPLHMVAEMGPQNLLEHLIEKGAKIDAISNDGTPLQIAAFESTSRKHIVEVLLNNRASRDVTSPGLDLQSPLYSSVANGSIDCVKLLLQAGADPKNFTEGDTPLGIAATISSPEIINCLLEAGADPNVCNRNGKVPIEVAAWLDRREAVKGLLPGTSPISSIADWSVDGILNFAADAREKMKKNLLRSKSKGEEAFKRKDYHEAIKCYTETLCYARPDKAVVIHSKLSLCWARLNKGDNALKHARSCHKLRPDWSKGYYRKGRALMVLKKYKKAADAFYKGWKLNLKNKELENAFRQAIEAEKVERELSSSTTRNMDGTCLSHIFCGKLNRDRCKLLIMMKARGN